ncbi:SpoVR family protein [Candidatus Berkiella aquae]|uniref:SpoVR family protein n=1 Tax=Candidatus Berkiella aquae TaxID=295108 RepID=A0A0Q9YPR1_9GAMM|nr:SpoVR family protein [Candidatus Berkiella aquae]MCS5711858.1 SpoVR family protein [Candidatus Berkiella aquae]
MAKAKNTIISDSSEWTHELLGLFDKEISRIAQNFKLDTYPNQIEIINSEQMLDAYSSVGMPLGYSHWSFGKQFLNVEKHYRRGYMGLAYELVINSNPCIAYLMEENTLAMQALVIAHACYGHNSFFKNNYLFKTWTSPDSIIDYLVFAKNYIAECEEHYGIDEVEEIIDACHALMNNGVDRYKRPNKISLQEEKTRQANRAEYLQSLVNELWRTLPAKQNRSDDIAEKRFPEEPQENILYFIEKHAPLLEPWEREIVRIVRKIAQYFYPQKQTKVMNEGWATFWHYTIMNQLYTEGLINDDFMIEFLHNHTNVIYQPSFDSQFYSGINPYTLGFSMFCDIRRLCENPTDEDKKWFPDIAGSNWIETLDFAMRNFKDESFIAQFLSPKVMRDLKLFSILDDDDHPDLEVDLIHNEDGYHRLRQSLSENYNLGNLEPDIQVYNVDVRGDRSLTLRYTQRNRRPIGHTKDEVVKHLYRLWKFPIRLEMLNDENQIQILSECPPRTIAS